MCVYGALFPSTSTNCKQYSHHLIRAVSSVPSDDDLLSAIYPKLEAAVLSRRIGVYNCTLYTPCTANSLKLSPVVHYLILHIPSFYHSVHRRYALRVEYCSVSLSCRVSFNGNCVIIVVSCAPSDDVILPSTISHQLDINSSYMRVRTYPMRLNMRHTLLVTRLVHTTRVVVYTPQQ